MSSLVVFVRYLDIHHVVVRQSSSNSQAIVFGSLGQFSFGISIASESELSAEIRKWINFEIMMYQKIFQPIVGSSLKPLLLLHFVVNGVEPFH